MVSTVVWRILVCQMAQIDHDRRQRIPGDRPPRRADAVRDVLLGERHSQAEPARLGNAMLLYQPQDIPGDPFCDVHGAEVDPGYLRFAESGRHLLEHCHGDTWSGM